MRGSARHASLSHSVFSFSRRAQLRTKEIAHHAARPAGRRSTCCVTVETERQVQLNETSSSYQLIIPAKKNQTRERTRKTQLPTVVKKRTQTSALNISNCSMSRSDSAVKESFATTFSFGILCCCCFFFLQRKREMQSITVVRHAERVDMDSAGGPPSHK